MTIHYLLADLPDGLIDLCREMFALVPVGFLLGMMCGLLSFGIFGLFGLVRKLIR